LHIEVSDLTLKTPEQNVISDKISFSLTHGELLLLEGGNGSGKTTLIKTLLGLHQYYDGYFERYIELTEIEYVPQQSNLHFFLPLTLGDVIQLKFQQQDQLQLLRQDQKQRAWNVASGGEKQKALLTSAIQNPSKVLILDEPFNHLDRDSKTLLISILNAEVKKGKSILLISHESSVEGLTITQKIVLEPYV
jgi:ABC-type Mn2+/Zn2+ transport system ATPase subunit